MVMGIGFPSEAWRALTKTVAETREAAYGRGKREFELLKIGISETVTKYFTRVHVVLTKLMRHQVTIPAREIKCRVVRGITPRFPDEIREYTVKYDFDLKDLNAGLVRVESFQPDQERRDASAHALAVAHTGGGRAGARGGARGGKCFAKRHDGGRGRNQQQHHPEQIHPGQQQRSQHHQQQMLSWQPQQRRHPQHQQHDPWANWVRPPPQLQYRSGALHQRRQQHWRGDQSYWHQPRTCHRCGEVEHSPAECKAT